VVVGMLGRFFPLNWRPPLDEIRFAAEHGFDALQIRSDRVGEIGDDLRADPRVLGLAFAASGVEPVLEMPVLHHGERTERMQVVRAVAARAGPIVGITTLAPGDRDVPLERLVVERSLSINTAAAGGNATLMTMV